jgi:hypothetical protein
MPKISTPWDRPPKVDPSTPGSVPPDVDSSVSPSTPVPPEAPTGAPRVTWEARVRPDGSVVIPVSLISPVMGVVLGWWRGQPHGVPTRPPQVTPTSVPVSEDAVIDQRSGLFPKDLYLRLARGGEFPSRKIGKRIVARLGDVRAAFAGRSGPPEPTPPLAASKEPPQDDGLDHLRAQVGLARKGK